MKLCYKHYRVKNTNHMVAIVEVAVPVRVENEEEIAMVVPAMAEVMKEEEGEEEEKREEQERD